MRNTFTDKTTFSISAKIQDGTRKSEKCKIFRCAKGVVLGTLGVQNFPKIAVSLTVFKINNILHFRQNSRWQPKIGRVYNF